LPRVGRISSDTGTFLAPLSPSIADFKNAIFSIDTPTISSPTQGGPWISISFLTNHFQHFATTRGDSNLRYTGSQFITSLDQFSDQFPSSILELANKSDLVWPGPALLPPISAYPLDDSSSSSLCQMAVIAWFRGATLHKQGRILDEEFSPAGVFICGGCAARIKSSSIAKMTHLYLLHRRPE